jgi:hypothetical protein
MIWMTDMKSQIGEHAYVYQSQRRSGKSLAEMLARGKLVERDLNIMDIQLSRVIFDEYSSISSAMWKAGEAK